MRFLGLRHAAETKEHMPAGQVEFHIDARMLKGSVGTSREAIVEFEDRHIVINVVDCGGDYWTLQTTILPGPTIKEQFRFMLSKNGEDLRDILEKAAAADIAWHQKTNHILCDLHVELFNRVRVDVLLRLRISTRSYVLIGLKKYVDHTMESRRHLLHHW
mmetsp:Transcript_57952/g.111775  ORF Transcript_57952/g.111775 Transcript_57952/m.111775 type:complete len:160 (-) Transcript_57952:263-742(-)